MKRAIAITLALVALPALGLCQVDETPAQPPADGGEGQVVVMRAIWPGGDLTNTSFRVFEDEQMRRLVDIFPAPDGTAMAVLRPGEYYVMAVVDANGNNQVDAGDAFGFHGVADLSGESQPSPATIEENALNQLTVPILMIRAEDGRLVPLPSALQASPGTLTGKVEGVSGAGKPTLLVALPVGMDSRPVVAPVGADGMFTLQVPAGGHMLVAIADADASGTVTAADLVATAGTAEAPISVGADESKALAQSLTLSADHAAPEGIPPLVAGRITGVEIPRSGRASVAFCTDQSMRNEAFSVAANADGIYAAAVPVNPSVASDVSEASVDDDCPAGGTHEPGERDARGRLHCAKCGRFISEETPDVAPSWPRSYYARATIDQAADGMLGVGDMLGFFGVDDLLAGGIPVGVKVTENALMTNVDIAVTARIGDDGRLTPWPPAEAEEGTDG